MANLASSLALNGAKVLAVDADLRRPTMHQHFGIPKTPGLSDLIVGKCQASEAIQVTRFKGLQVLPCGYVPPNPAELLGSAAMKQVVDALRSHYDWVLIDTPPILAMADTPVLCPLVDGVILVIGAEISGRPAIQRAVDQITGVGGKIDRGGPQQGRTWSGTPTTTVSTTASTTAATTPRAQPGSPAPWRWRRRPDPGLAPSRRA